MLFLKLKAKWESPKEDSIADEAKLEGSKQRKNSSRTEYSVFLEGKVYPNVGN